MSAKTPYPVFSALWLKYWQDRYFGFADTTTCMTGREFYNLLQTGVSADMNRDWSGYYGPLTDADAQAAGFLTLAEAEQYAQARQAAFENAVVQAFVARCTGSSYLPAAPTTSAGVAAYLDAAPAANAPDGPVPRSIGGVSLLSPQVAVIPGGALPASGPVVPPVILAGQPPHVPLTADLSIQTAAAAGSATTGSPPVTDTAGQPVVDIPIDQPRPWPIVVGIAGLLLALWLLTR